VTQDAAILVDPHDVDSIATGIQRVLSDDILSEEMSRKGLQRAQDFSWDKCAQQVLSLLEDVGAGRPPAGSLAAITNALARG